MFENIYSKGVLIGQKYCLDDVSSTFFPTKADVTMQFGVGVVKDKKAITPHIHKRVKRTIDSTSEFLFVLYGQMNIDIYDEDENFVQTVILKKNQCLLQFIGGHAITIEANTKYFELKQGPYFGRDFDKYDLDITK